MAKDIKDKKETKEKKEIAVKESKPPKASKPKKEPKTVSQEKLPKMFKKKYSEKKYNKLLKHVYIESDKKLVQSIFEKQQDKKGRDIYAVDTEKEIVKGNAARLKVVAKQVKKQKGGFKLIPLIAVVVLIVGIGITVTMFKNVIVKKAIVSVMQGIFQAKTDIEKVDVQIFGASLEVKGLQQANKDEPMKNIFQIDDIALDFNLTELLRGKIHVEKVSVEGVALDTDRKKSGKIPVKDKNKKKKKEINAEKNNLVTSAKAKLEEMFASYNPETMIKEIQDELKSPALAQNIYKDVQEKTNKWKDTPAKFEKSVNDFSASVQEVVNTDWAKVQDLAKLKSALETVTRAINQGQELSNTVTKTVNEVNADSKIVIGYGTEIQDAVNSDKKLIETKVNDIKHLFSVDGITEIMTDAVKSIVYEYTGKFAPYVDMVLDTAMTTAGNALTTAKNKTDAEKQADKEIKAAKKGQKKAAKAAKKAKKQGRKRASGRDIYYKKDRVPKLLIEEAVASGYEYGTDKLLFKGTAKNITSNQDMIGRNTSVEADFKIKGNPNSANVIIDARKEAASPLVLANYNGKGFDIAADAEVFKLTSKSDITALLSADKTGKVNVSGILDMNVTSMTGMDFEPAAVCKLYKNALAGIPRLTVGFGIGYSLDGNLSVELKEMDKLTRQLVTPVTNALMAEVNTIAASAKDDAIKMLSEKTGIATDSIAQFADISTAMNAAQNKMDGLQKQLDAKKKELENMIADYGKKAAGDALKNVVPNAPSIPSGGSKDDAKDAAGKALKGLLGR